MIGYYSESSQTVEWANIGSCNRVNFNDISNMRVTSEMLMKLEPAVLAEEVIFTDIAEGVYDAHRAEVNKKISEIEDKIQDILDNSPVLSHLRKLDILDDELHDKIRGLKWYQNGDKLVAQKEDLLRQAKKATGLVGARASSITGVIRKFEDSIRKTFDFPRAKSPDEVRAILRLTKNMNKKTFAELLTIVNEA